MSDKITRCTHCYAEFSRAELLNAKCCPNCKTTGIPCQIADDVTLKINWHELRILGIWADNYSHNVAVDRDARGLVARIIARLEAQHPDKPPLTLGGEIRKVQERFPGASLVRDDGQLLVPPVKIN